MRKYGFKMSKLDGTEYQFNVNSNASLPETFSYKKFLPGVLNQGEKSICVPCALSAHLDWNYNVDHEGRIFKNNKISLDDIYNARKDKSKDNGMQIKEALDFLRKTGVRSKNGILKIKHYAMIPSYIALKYALIMNGPCIGALRVYNENKTDFWNRDFKGQDFLGGHAVAIIGYDKNGFIIRNSWGGSYGRGGYATISYDDAGKFLELWTIYD